MEGTSGSHLVQSPCSRKTTQSRLPSTMSRWLFKISKEGDSVTSLGNLLQCSVTHTVKKCFLRFRRNFCCCWAMLKEPGCFFAHSVQVFIHIDKIDLSHFYIYIFITLVRCALGLLFSMLNSPSSLSF